MVAGIMASGNGSVNRGSRLLSREENDAVMQMLGNRCESLATSVVQLFVTEAPSHSTWVKRDAGILCLVKDHFKRSYFLRLYCLVRRALVWEHEVYNNMEYNAAATFLHTFEGQDGIVGFNFASEEDARVTQNVLLERLDRKQRKLERKSRTSYTSTRHSATPPTPPPPPAANRAPTMNGTSMRQTPPHYDNHRQQQQQQQHQQYQPQARQQQSYPPPSHGKSSKNKGAAKAKITKADIGLPVDFRHVSHVGWDPNKGFDVDVEDPQLKQFFDKAGVSDSQLQDRETREFIYDFINQHGGLDAVKEEEAYRPPPVPARAGPLPPPSNQARNAPPPPPPPSRTVPPPLPSQPPAAAAHVPPPPPPLRTLPQRAHQDGHNYNTNAGAAAPPPPPPPPPPPCGPMPPPPQFPSGGAARGAPEAPDAHSALMSAIKSGKALKPADVEATKRPSSGGDTRDELLDQIRSGTQLKPVQHVPKPAAGAMPADSLAGALARALAERNRANHSDSSDAGSSSGSDDDEWED